MGGDKNGGKGSTRQKNERKLKEAFENAKTYEELIPAAKDYMGFNITDYVKNKVHFESAKKALEGIKKTFDEFGVSEDFALGIAHRMYGKGTTFDVSSAGAMSMYSDGSGININSKYYGTKEKAEAVKLLMGAPFHPKNADEPDMVAAHEAGHMLQSFEFQVGANPGKKEIRKGGSLYRSFEETGKMIFKEAADSYYKELKDKGEKVVVRGKETARPKYSYLQSQISGYATKNKSEAVAEAVADWMANRENAAPMSRHIVKVLKERIKATKQFNGYKEWRATGKELYQ